MAVISAMAIACILAVFCKTVRSEEFPAPGKGVRNETVVLVHGLARSGVSMKLMEKRLQHQGYEVVNIDYPSTEQGIGYIAQTWLAPEVQPRVAKGERVHFVTHSMGGALWYGAIWSRRPMDAAETSSCLPLPTAAAK